MSDIAVKKFNSILPSERRNSCIKKGTMKVMLDPPNDENLHTIQSVSRSNGSIASKVSCGGLSGHFEAPADPIAQEIEYIPSEDLTPIGDVEKSLLTLLHRLDSKEWLTVLEALNHVRQLSIFNASEMVDILNAVVSLVIKAMKNPRSALCKTAIMTSADLLKAYSDQLLETFDPLLLQLLLKASQDKKFVCEEAERALFGMTTWITPNPLLQKLEPYVTHRNPRVRAKAAICVSKSVSRLGVHGIKDYGLEPLIQLAAAQVNDQLPEAREAARKLVFELHGAYKQITPSNEEPDVNATLYQPDGWEQYCASILAPTAAHAILRITCNGSSISPS
ncbi:hypothetical protein O6H91_04G105400 [Diphasiastrum complanatum]|uniref:Uncharacterized protein n=3 Tax=Diphasiastrum complanatum TaxID=34168 RepID=A0ACC2E0W4_DIPCM|nr:hypothetical protein O6H91_04G105400 [Diphasiastrum complanatum]KAJ7559895.1 hypothetical protein O6H91_04G105400 [Diphasiastrum complanatum]